MRRSLHYFCPVLTLCPKSSFNSLSSYVWMNKGRALAQVGGIFPLNSELCLGTLSFSCTDAFKEILWLSFKTPGQITWLFHWSLSQTQLAFFATNSTNNKMLYFSVRNQFTAEHALCKHTGSQYSTVCSQGKIRKAISEKSNESQDVPSSI